MHAIRHAIIPAPVRFDCDRGEFTFRSGTMIAYTNTDVAPIVERFCLEVTRRTGLRILPMANNPGPKSYFPATETVVARDLVRVAYCEGRSSIGSRRISRSYRS
jgi:hypothetical protein